MSDRVRAAIVGASGIGKHHAKWLAALGAEICAIVGSSEASVQATARSLQEQFGFTAKGYTGLGPMLEVEDPDLVHICTPPERHHEHVMAAAPQRCHLLCEKPLTWDESKPAPQLLEEAREMTQACERKGRQTAVNLQYTAAPSAYLNLCREIDVEVRPPTQFFMQMESRREHNRYEITWRELSPHALSIMMAFCGPGRVDSESADLEIGERQCRARFAYQPRQGPTCACEIVVGTALTGPLTRRFGINGLLADYEGRNDEKGVFCTYLKIGEVERESADFMFLSMQQMLLAVTGQSPRPLATMAEGLVNEEMQIGILARGRRV